MAQFVVMIYRDEAGYRGTIDGVGLVRGRTLREVVRESRVMVTRVLDGALPDREGMDPAGAALVVRFEIELRTLNWPGGWRVRPVSRSAVAVRGKTARRDPQAARPGG